MIFARKGTEHVQALWSLFQDGAEIDVGPGGGTQGVFRPVLKWTFCIDTGSPLLTYWTEHSFLLVSGH